MAGSLENVAGSSTAIATEHLRTDHLAQNLGRRAVSGGFVTMGAQAAKFILNFASAAVLGRLLNPSEFGLVGMVLGITALVGIFNNLGLSMATVQRENITQKQVSNLFWVNVGFSACLTVLCMAVAPLVARFYRDPRVAGIMLALSLTFLLTGSTVQHRALLARQMRFHSLATIDVSSLLIGFITASVLAKLGFAYWALVAQQLIYALTTLVLTWCLSKWRPSMPSRNSGVAPLLNFGVHLTVADFAGQLSANSDSILVGRFFGAAPLGLYTRASVLLARPLQQVLSPINSVLIPVLSRLQSDAERYRRTYLRAYDTLALIVFPFSAMCFVLARPLVLVILGPKWTAAVPLFSAFTLVALSAPLMSVAIWIFESQGRGSDQLRNHTTTGAITVLSYLIGLHWGPLGVVVSSAAFNLFVCLPIVYYFAGHRGPVSTRDLWMGFLLHLPCWGACFVTTTLAHMTVANSAPIVQLLICVPIGLGAGWGLTLLFRRPRESAVYAWCTIRKAIKTSASAQGQHHDEILPATGASPR